MENIMNYTSYTGQASKLCTKGDAAEFIQPWYTPISTTPENTGMAVGGVGSTFTLTPEGHTPNFSFIPGIFIDCSHQDINFNDFFISSMDLPTLDNIQLKCITDTCNHLNYYPALFCGKTLDLNDTCNLLDNIKLAIESLNFYEENKENFQRWNIDLSDKTKFHLEQAPKAVFTQLLVAIDFFDGLLINGSAIACSLTANRQGEVASINSEKIQYQALYPIAHYQYSGIDDVQVERKVISPIVKDDKKLCSLPMHWNHFEFKNTSDKVKIVTLVQPLENLIGSTYRKGRDGIQDSFCTLTQNPIDQHHESVLLSQANSVFKGIRLSSATPYASDIEGEVNFGAQVEKSLVTSGQVCVSVKPSVYSTDTEEQLINALNTGRTSKHFDKGIYSGRESLKGLVCVQVELAPNEQVEFRVAQIMDHSKIALNGWHSHKAYAQFYSKSNRSQTILAEVLPQLAQIEQKIVSQQDEFYAQANQQFGDANTALQFSTMAMNTLSFLAESTVWDYKDKFLVKECVDYPFFNSLDVYFYGSFSLLYLLPELDGCVMKEFSKAILASDDTKRRYWEYEDKPYAELVDKKFEGIRAVRGAVIHDLGSPYDIQPDAYSWHNVKEWKDLAPKYILMVYRHYQHSGDATVVKECWPAIEESIEFLSSLIEEGDTLPLTRGTDDTFDNLSSHGISIYCASLWSAGLKAAAQLAKLMGENELSESYKVRSDEALQTLEKGLWDEEKGYYHFFVTPIQQKHLTGQGFEKLASLGVELSGEPLKDKVILNAYLDDVERSSKLSKLEQRIAKKKLLVETAPQAFTAAYSEMVLDSDNSFGDALLADSYLKLIGLEGLFTDERIARSLDYIYQTNFVENSPKLGVANMTLADGKPHEAFQAQDVWIGVQFSVATALRLAGKTAQSEQLIATVYNALYHYAKIPFAAPEGFNCSVEVTVEELAKEFKLDSEGARQWLDMLKEQQCLLADGRVNPNLTKQFAEFESQIKGFVDESQRSSLHSWLLTTGLKYTAGRYFRPGMIFAYMYQSNRDIIG